MARGVALLILLLPAVQAARQRREIFNAIVLGFALRKVIGFMICAFEYFYYSRGAFWACVEMKKWWSVKSSLGKGVPRLGAARVKCFSRSA